MYKSKARRIKKDLRVPIEGNGYKLAPGETHQVKISNVVLQLTDSMGVRIENNNVYLVTFEDSFGNSHTERLFIFSTSEEDLSYLTKQLLIAVAPSSSALRGWYDDLFNHDFEAVFSQLSGRPCKVETQFIEEYINLKCIRGVDDKNNDGSFLQSVGSDHSHTTETKTSPVAKTVLPLSPELQSFLNPNRG